MEDCEGQKKSSFKNSQKLDALKSQSDLIEDGHPARYQMKTVSHEEFKSYRKLTFGERDTKKTHKTILLVGETGTGKTTLINAMINYMLGVKREDKVWFEITDDQSELCSAYRQTTIITVYGFYLQESQTDLTIIDTPGYGDTRQGKSDIAMSLLRLLKSAEMISEIHTVCLVIKSTQTRLSDRQIYIFDAVQSLFGKDLAENIVLLITHSRGAIPKNVLMVVKETQIKCAVNEQNQPVFFLFDNWQSDATDKQSEMMQEQMWKLSSEGMAGFFKFLGSIKAKTLEMTQNVLHQQQLLDSEISNIQTHIQNEIQIRQRKTKDLEQKKEWEKTKKNSKAEDEPLKIKMVDTDIVYAAVSCTVCNATCSEHSWWVTPLSWCEVMRDGNCTVCTNKCHYKEHVKGAKIYKSKDIKGGQKVKGKREDSNEDCHDKIVYSSSVKNIQKEPQDIKKVKLVMDAFHCVEKLQLHSLNTDSLIVLQHIDFMIEMLKEIQENEKAKILENIKKRAGEEKHRALEYMKICVKSENQKV